MYGIIDNACANELGVDVDLYVEKIEKTTNKRAELIISALFSDNSKSIEKAKRIFNLIK